ncbi:right-handed parallel beta-helix repeat-containing protein [Candidatus Parcubacteria bacterium]|nr:right-handed parallel beta-helix repeat-containing protein [Candidatus Parcubacteria bacterium]
MFKKLCILFVFIISLAFIGPVDAASLADSLSGKILLQVEDNGEAWYINPDTKTRYYMGRPADAFALMRELGLGISNADFDLFNLVAPSRLSGQILLRVEENGEAYYVNPENNEMLFLGRPADAFQIMRAVGLGITNASLSTLTIETGYDIPPQSDSGQAAEEEPALTCPESYCDGNINISYEIQDEECVAIEDDCSDCSCNCGGYNISEEEANDNCGDGIDNDCDGFFDDTDEDCIFNGTEISADINDNIIWTKEMSPYRLLNSIEIASNKILTIEPGVAVEFVLADGVADLGGVSIIVKGSLSAVGMEGEEITFLSVVPEPLAGDWGAIEIINGGIATFEYVSIKHASTAIRAANAKNLTVENTIISNSNTGIFTIGPATIEHNYILNNKTGLVHAGVIDSIRDDGSYKNFDRITNINYNTIQSNIGESGVDAGLRIENITTGGYRLICKFNELDANTNGILFKDSDSYNLMEVEQNNIMNSLEYNAYVDSQGPNITLEKTWWGTTVLDTITDKIFDFYDVNYSLPQIDYKPFYNAPVSGAGAN